jgi:predicted metallo-beta-lactamase superfamily hydrolase
MIKKIVPLGFDSFGVRSMATYVETKDLKILIDPGVSLAPLRYGMEPHPLEWQRLDETWETIKRYAEESDVLVVTHYHYDHQTQTIRTFIEEKQSSSNIQPKTLTSARKAAPPIS